MSNVGRPRTGLKKCAYCGSTKRDSNGQCSCRNTLYRALRNAPKSIKGKVTTHFNVALKNKKGDPQSALAVTREAYPAIAPKPRKAATKKAAPATPKRGPRARAAKKAAPAPAP